MTRDIALQPTVSHDSVNVIMTAIAARARPGFGFSYRVAYKNAGSTNLSATTIALHYNNSLLTFTNATNPTVTNSVNTLTLNLPSLPVGEFGEFSTFFTISTTAPLGNILTADAAMSGGAIASADTARTTITGSYDPNDKTATPTLTPEQVSNGAYIDYFIRFQNTGTDTAIHVVITDTLSNQLQTNTLELIMTSHPCIATIKDNVATFEMRNIMLPDSNINEPASHGFIRFRVKPLSTLVTGNTVDNKAAIYFDYNSPVITNTAVTQIMSAAMPLKLISFNGRRIENGTVNLYWYTNNEMNTKTFVIEQSKNGRDFSIGGEVIARGNGNNSYSFNVANINKGNTYFRLKMLDKDGKFSYSPVILIRDNNKASFVLFENPVKNKLLLTSIATSLINTEGMLINNVGAVVKQFTIHSSSQIISVNNLSSGVYYLKTLEGSEKVIISR